MKRTLVAVLGGGLLLGLAGGYIYHHYVGPLPVWHPGGNADQDDRPAGDASPEGSSDVHGLGWLEPAGGVIEVCAPPGDRVKILVEVGEPVAEGDPLAVLESRKLRKTELESIDAQIKEAEAQLQAELNAADARIKAAELKRGDAEVQRLDKESLADKIKLLRSNLALYQKDLERLHTLKKGSEKERPGALPSMQLVSQQEIDRQELVVEQAKAELAAAEADGKKLEKAHEETSKAVDAELNVLNAGKETIKASDPLPPLRRARKMAQLQRRETKVRAPIKGVVLKKFLDSGEVSTQRPVLQMADLESMVAVVEVYESDVKRIWPGQPVRIESDAFREPHDKTGLRGKVVEIGQIFSTAETTSLDPYARADRHAIPVRVEVDDAGTPEAASFINLQVEAVFLDPK